MSPESDSTKIDSRQYYYGTRPDSNGSGYAQGVVYHWWGDRIVIDYRSEAMSESKALDAACDWAERNDIEVELE